MAIQRVKFTFQQELITLPIIYELGKQFNIVTNIRRADVTEDRGWVVLELEGEMEEIERGRVPSAPPPPGAPPWLPVRRRNRLNLDVYREPGRFFVTISTQGRRPWFR